jgi:hypothetical protein
MQDTESMTLGMWVDYIIEWNNMNEADEKKSKQNQAARRATQRDFDAF